MKWVHVHGQKPALQRENGEGVILTKYRDMLKGDGFDVEIWFHEDERPRLLLVKDGSLKAWLLGGSRILAKRYYTNGSNGRMLEEAAGDNSRQ